MTQEPAHARPYVIAGIDYTELIAERTQNFTGREWAFQAVDEWLAPNEKRVFLLTGGPGSGKSALAARLVQMSEGEAPVAEYPRLAQSGITFFHFCQAFNDPTLDPLRFAKNLSLILANQYQPFAKALTGVGEREPEIQVHIEAGVVAPGAAISGIKELYIGNVSARVAFERVVSQPLRELYQSGFDEQIFIVVDALDEALTYDRDENIVTLLGHATDHPRDLPPKVRFLFTSRPDDRVEHSIGKPTLDLIDDSPDDVDDVRAYAYRRLRALNGPRRSVLADKIAEVGKGNFLYARYVIDDLPPDIGQVEDIGEFPLPDDLNDHYRRFLKRELARTLEKWGEQYRPLLGLFSVARGDGLSRDQLAEAAGLRQSKTGDILIACRQYLSGSFPEGPFRIYHQSFREFLLSNSEYPVYPTEAHEAIADMYQSLEREKWDNYGWRHLPFHLSNAGRGQELRRLLLDFDWMQSKLDATDVQDLMADYDYLPGDADLSLVQDAIRLSAHILVHDKKQLAGHLLCRLLYSSRLLIQEMLEIAKNWKGSPWLRPLTSSLQSPEGPLVRTFGGHLSGVYDVSITPNKRYAISASDDHTLKVWNIESGEELHTLQGHTQRVNAVAVTPDGKHAISASSDTTLKVWNIERGEEQHTLQGHTQRVNAVAVTPDGKHAISASDDHTLKVWNISSGRAITNFTVDSSITTLATSTREFVIVFGEYLGNVHILKFVE